MNNKLLREKNKSEYSSLDLNAHTFFHRLNASDYKPTMLGFLFLFFIAFCRYRFMKKKINSVHPWSELQVWWDKWQHLFYCLFLFNTFFIPHFKKTKCNFNICYWWFIFLFNLELKKNSVSPFGINDLFLSSESHARLSWSFFMKKYFI